MTAFALREVREDDWEFWRWLHHVAERATIERQFGPWDEAVQDVFARKTWEDTEGERAVIMVDGIDAGWLHVKPKDGEIFLNQLILHPDYQNQGIGSAILEDLMMQAEDEGKILTLQTLLENSARLLYEKRGFKVVKKGETHWFMAWEPGQ